MSRIWKQAIPIAAWVKVNLDNNVLSVTWPKGTLYYSLPSGVALTIDESTITVVSTDVSLQHMRWLVRTLISNMVIGVSQGFEKKLHIMGVWFNAKVAWSKLVLNLWFSHPIEFESPDGISFSAEKDPKWNDIVTVQWYDKQKVWQVAASLRMLRKPEPYKGKWVRYFGEKVRQKAGKTAGK